MTVVIHSSKLAGFLGCGCPLCSEASMSPFRQMICSSTSSTLRLFWNGYGTYLALGSKQLEKKVAMHDSVYMWRVWVWGGGCNNQARLGEYNET